MKKEIKGKSQHFLNNEPITSSKNDEDIFKFGSYAKKIQQLVKNNSLDPNPFTIGIYGKWGEGKTSFMNLIKEGIDIKQNNEKGILIYDFNPWRYSSEDEILFDFFDGLSKTMMITEDDHIKKAGKGIIKLSNYLKAVKISASVGVPGIIGGKIELSPDQIVKQIGNELQGEKLTIEKLSKQVNDYLLDADYKVAVFIDDLDRLDKEEIYTILKIIKLNAHFQNFVYLLTLDQQHAAKAISKRYGSKKKDGYLFLEKIINLPIHLPRISRMDLFKFFELKLKFVIQSLDVQNRLHSEEVFREIYDEVDLEIFKSPREIITVINSFFISAFSIGEEVNLRDLFWLEILKIKNEKFYNDLKKYHFSILTKEIIDFNDELTVVTGGINGSRKFYSETYKEDFYIFKKLFPAKEMGTFPRINKAEILSNLRINSFHHFEKYFTYSIGQHTSNNFILEINKFTENEDLVKLAYSINELFENDVNGDSFHLFLDLIKTIQNNAKVLLKFIIENLKELPNSNLAKDIFGRTFHEQVLEQIGLRLNGGIIDEEIILRIVDKLDEDSLCYLTRRINSSTSLRRNLEKQIVEKTKLNLASEPFYLDDQKLTNRMIIQCWSDVDLDGLLEYINSTLTSEYNIKQLIRNFVNLDISGNFSALENSNYNYLKEIIDPDQLFNKLSEINSKLVTEVDPENFIIKPKENYTSEENLEQFIYWYKRNSAQ